MADLDRLLSDDPGAVARSAEEAAAVPDFAAVVRRGRARRTRRQAGVLGAAALAVAGIVASVQLLGRGGSEPSPAPAPEPPPHGATVDVPYWSAGAVHVGEQRIATEHRTLRYAGGTTLVGTSPATGRSRWFLVEDTALVPVVDTPYPTTATVSPDGAVVALVGQVAEERRELMLWDVGERRPVATTDVAVHVECCDKSGELSVLGIDLDHRVLYVDRRTMLWTPGRAPVEVTGAAGSFVAGSQQWPRGATHQQSGVPSGVFGTVTPDGVFQRQGTVTSDQVGLWSPDGASFVSSDGHRVVVEGVDGGPSSDLPVPAGGWWRLVAWESPTTVLLDVDRPQSDDSGLRRVTGLARCDVEAISCTELEPPATPLVWPVVGLW